MSEKEKVLNVFKSSENPLRPGDIAKETGIESKEVSKFIKSFEKKVKCILLNAVITL